MSDDDEDPGEASLVRRALERIANKRTSLVAYAAELAAEGEWNAKIAELRGVELPTCIPTYFHEGMRVYVAASAAWGEVVRATGDMGRVRFDEGTDLARPDAWLTLDEVRVKAIE